MKKILLVLFMTFILMPIFAQTDDVTQEMLDRMTSDEYFEYLRIQSELSQQRLEQVYKPSVRDAVKISFDVLEGIGQLPQGTELVRQESYNRRNIFNYTDNSIDGVRLEIIFIRNFSGVGGTVHITYSGEMVMTMYNELCNLLYDYYGVSDVSYKPVPPETSDDADVTGRISPRYSLISYNFTLIYRKIYGSSLTVSNSRRDYARLSIESIGF